MIWSWFFSHLSIKWIIIASNSSWRMGTNLFIEVNNFCTSKIWFNILRKCIASHLIKHKITWSLSLSFSSLNIDLWSIQVLSIWISNPKPKSNHHHHHQFWLLWCRSFSSFYFSILIFIFISNTVYIYYDLYLRISHLSFLTNDTQIVLYISNLCTSVCVCPRSHLQTLTINPLYAKGWSQKSPNDTMPKYHTMKALQCAHIKYPHEIPPRRFVHSLTLTRI